ncbi:hypothetical protein LX15_002491 [Streptoalloteichus tenebrarius]|uniref:Uncharacterized protein n=1 Tax=Streptoalloteichus tenebrarius (strain ATCC 17920 / DSM 40477 / JCM 4838 / CBS 697.72 / NBRC 16177 / NCIMB 11028 / NRRL B-12390 / A12253. 1 / ISP 5477) TaxID=1933 RepID=A0ABT1HTF0_STRSD|nr:hypothetical protein [Streptoalloteichus tenebrarius]BFE99529.1 hypothetical protein GCM10020241_12050 [Streptoalloteichus tenebrarius]
MREGAEEAYVAAKSAHRSTAPGSPQAAQTALAMAMAPTPWRSTTTPTPTGRAR